MISAQKIPHFTDYLCKAPDMGFAFLFHFAFLLVILHFYSKSTGEEII